MSQQSDAFVRQVLKGHPGPVGLGEMVQYLRQLAGSGRAAGRLVGLSESTFRGVASGRTRHPKPATLQKIETAYRANRIRPSKMGDHGVLINAVSQDRRRGDRERAISGKQLQLQPGTLNATVATWLVTGDSEATYKRFLQGVGEPWYRSQLARGAEFDEYVDDDVVLDSDYGMSIG